jgi:hypothetical protein
MPWPIAASRRRALPPPFYVKAGQRELVRFLVVAYVNYYPSLVRRPAVLLHLYG